MPRLAGLYSGCGDTCVRFALAGCEAQHGVELVGYAYMGTNAWRRSGFCPHNERAGSGPLPALTAYSPGILPHSWRKAAGLAIGHSGFTGTGIASTKCLVTATTPFHGWCPIPSLAY